VRRELPEAVSAPVATWHRSTAAAPPPGAPDVVRSTAPNCSRYSRNEMLHLEGNPFRSATGQLPDSGDPGSAIPEGAAAAVASAPRRSPYCEPRLPAAARAAALRWNCIQGTRAGSWWFQRITTHSHSPWEKSLVRPGGARLFGEYACRTRRGSFDDDGSASRSTWVRSAQPFSVRPPHRRARIPMVDLRGVGCRGQTVRIRSLLAQPCLPVPPTGVI
jgi:hypothetical protein